MTRGVFIRAFIAINLPEEVRSHLSELQRDLKSALPGDGLRWTQPGQIHLTLQFLGDIAADSVEDLKKAIGRACDGIRPFSLRAESLGVFPHPRKPRVIWTDANGDTDILRRLQERIEHETAAWHEAEPRTFQPHLTLARIKSLKPREGEALQEKLRAHAAAQFGTWNVTQIELIQSKLSSSGAEYFPLAEFPLS